MIKNFVIFSTAYVLMGSLLPFIKPVFENLASKLKNNRFENSNKYEEEISHQIIDPDTIDINLESIGGLNDVIEIIRSDIIYFTKNLNLLNDLTLFRLPKGILFYGPPGCGKTMLVKAIAKECNIQFLNINLSVLLDKWYGQSLKLCKAMFTLAEKISPCIIFLDEIDSLLRTRSLNDHEVTSMMKSEFLRNWDGFLNNSSKVILLIGTTNRKMDIDTAFLNRFELQIKINYPNFMERIIILKKFLKDSDLENNFNFEEISKLISGASGRDINNLCRESSMIRIREQIKNSSSNEIDFNNLRKINKNDFIKAIKTLNLNLN